MMWSIYGAKIIFSLLKCSRDLTVSGGLSGLSYRGNRGQGRGTTRMGYKGRGGHNNSFGSRETNNSGAEGTETKDIGSCAVHEGECFTGDSTVRLE